MENVPSLPTNYQAIRAELDCPEPSLARIGEVISQDVAMTAKILQLVNSSFFGLARRVSSPADAAALLGLSTVQGLVLSAGIFSDLDQGGLGDFSADELMNHSLSVAATARAIAASMSKERALADDAFVAGLLHDIGKLVLAASFKGRYCEALASTRGTGLPSTTVETEQFGANHADIGGYLMNLWGLPSVLVEAIAFHHCPEKAMTTVFTPLTAVHVANALILEQDPDDGLSHGVSLHFNYLWEANVLDKIDDWRQLVGTSSPKGLLA
jgi:putative nucleotidyltransferase with HDIG domain